MDIYLLTSVLDEYKKETEYATWHRRPPQDGELAKRLRHWLLLPSTQVQFPTNTWRLTAYFDSHPSVGTRLACGAHTYMQSKHPFTQNDYINL